jgi:hypothetical protein
MSGMPDSATMVVQMLLREAGRDGVPTTWFRSPTKVSRPQADWGRSAPPRPISATNKGRTSPPPTLRSFADPEASGIGDTTCPLRIRRNKREFRS